MTTTEQGRVLKASAIRDLGSNVAFNFEDLRKRCDEYISRSRQQAAQILAAARAEAEALLKASCDEGRACGHREGRRQAETEIETCAAALAEQMTDDRLSSVLPAMKSVGEMLSLERDRWLAEWETGAVKLAAAIAEKIIRRHIEIRSEATSEMLAATLQLLTGTAAVRIRMNPLDVEVLGGHAEDVVRSLAGCADVSIIADDSVSRGGAIVETRHGSIDARIETQIERIVGELLS